MALNEEQKARLEALRSVRDQWKKADAERAEAQELDDLEHEAKLRDVVADLEAKLGKRGVFFEVIDTLSGPVAVKLGEAVTYTKFVDAMSDHGLNIADIQEFILPNLAYPNREEYLKLQHTGIPYAVWGVLAALFRGERDRIAGK
ncbi:MAG TPA: hypothetical protein VGH28_10550 [Polyangiaceae bacterium]|jgi:hypothetical protein